MKDLRKLRAFNAALLNMSLDKEANEELGWMNEPGWLDATKDQRAAAEKASRQRLMETRKTDPRAFNSTMSVRADSDNAPAAIVGAPFRSNREFRKNRLATSPRPLTLLDGTKIAPDSRTKKSRFDATSMYDLLRLTKTPKESFEHMQRKQTPTDSIDYIKQQIQEGRMDAQNNSKPTASNRMTKLAAFQSGLLGLDKEAAFAMPKSVADIWDAFVSPLSSSIPMSGRVSLDPETLTDPAETEGK